MNLTDIIKMFTDIGLRLIPLFGAIAFFMFLWGVARFIRAAGNEKELKESKNLLIWGLVGMFILMTIWGIVSFLRSEFGFNSDVGIPQFKIRSQ